MNDSPVVPRLLAVSDIDKLAILNLQGIKPMQVETNRHYLAVFRADEAESILEKYTSGGLTVIARDFAAVMKRVKDEIFEARRVARSQGNIFF